MKIVSLTPSGTELLASLDLLENLVACSHECNFPLEVEEKLKITFSKMKPNLTLNQIDSFVKSSKKAGINLYEIDQNILAQVKPDYILTQGLCEVCAVSEIDVKNTLKILTKDFRVDPKIISLSGGSILQVMDDIRRLGHEFGKMEKAEKILAEAKKTMREMLDKPRIEKSVLLLEWVDPFFSPGHWIPEQIRLAGFRSALGESGEKSKEISATMIRDTNPDYIVVVCCGFGLKENRAIAEQLYQNADINNLKAFSKKNIYAFDSDFYFSRPTLRLIEGARQLREALLNQSPIHRCV